jgi:hypothetical protein
MSSIIMKGIVFTLSLMAVPGGGQMANLEETRLKTLTGWKVRIENKLVSPIVALHAIYTCPATTTNSRASIHFVMDTLFNYGYDKPIAPGDYFAFPLGGGFSECPGGIDAVLFADGSTLGDPLAVNDIYERRRGVYKGIAVAKDELAMVASGDEPPATAITKLKEQSRVFSQKRNFTIAERDGEMYALALTIGLIEDQHDWSVPSDSTAKRQPRIEELMDARKIPRHQAHATIISNKLEEWASELKSNLDPHATR